MLLLGHRGARLPDLPENTVAAFEHALASGCDGFELDVRLTADHQSLICHDAEMCGLTVGRFPRDQIAARWEEQLMRRRPGSAFSHLRRESMTLTSLGNVLRRYGERAFLDIELKVPGLEETVIAAVAETRPLRYVVSSFFPEIIRNLHDRNAEIPLGVICDTQRQLAVWRDLPVDYVIPHYKLLTRNLVHDVQAAGKKVFAWTVNSPHEMERLASWGVDAMISDDPELLARTLRRSP